MVLDQAVRLAEQLEAHESEQLGPRQQERQQADRGNVELDEPGEPPEVRCDRGGRFGRFEAGRQVTITGNVARRVRGCGVANATRSIRIWGRGETPLAGLPQIVLRTPMDVHISAGEAVFGVIGRTTNLDLTNQGCGAWTVANVDGRMRVDQAGGGLTRTGAAQSADLSVAGSGRLTTQAVGGAVTAVSSGAGDIDVVSTKGPIDARIAGAGSVRIARGEALRMKASIAGSGDIAFGGAVKDLNAMIAGSGRVRVARVAGTVSKRVFGAGNVVIGP